jgi:hypothetical protein
MQSVEAATGGLAGMDFQHQRRRAMNLTYQAGLLLHNGSWGGRSVEVVVIKYECLNLV